MEEFDPPIYQRDDEELIIIANSTNGDWQQSAIEQAGTELRKRGVTPERQKIFLKKYKDEEELARQEESTGQGLPVRQCILLYIYTKRSFTIFYAKK